MVLLNRASTRRALDGKCSAVIISQMVSTTSLSMIKHELSMKGDSLSIQETTGLPGSRRCGFRRFLFQGMMNKLCRSKVLGIGIPRRSSASDKISSQDFADR